MSMQMPGKRMTKKQQEKHAEALQKKREADEQKLFADDPSKCKSPPIHLD